MGAAPDIVTVAVMDCPPITEGGLRVRDFGVGACTVRLALTPLAPIADLMVATVFVPTGVVEILKVAEDAFAGTVTDAGTDALV